MIKHFTVTVLCIFILLSLSFTSYAQKPINPHPNAVKIAVDYIVKLQKTGNLTEQDVNEHFVQDHYVTQDNGVTHVYVLQHHKGIELFNGIINVNVLPSGEVLYAGNRFMYNLAAAVNTTEPKLNAEEAIEAACKELNIEIQSPLRVKEKRSNIEFVFDKGTTVLSDINVKLRFQPINETQVHLAWDLNLDQIGGDNHWSVRVDAISGKIIDKNSWTRHCSFHPNAYHSADNCSDTPLSKISDLGFQISNLNTNSKSETQNSKLETVVGDGTYRVYALPVESPAHGQRTLVTSPADIKASPYGWHDINGVAGGDFKITRGNNVWAYLDVNDDNVSDTGEPNGGDTYTFDNPILPDGEPDTNKLAAQTNLFYMNNVMHDIFFNYGFDEAAGNFQVKNYSGAPGANDYVRAEAQDGAKAGTPKVNNANFMTPADGSSGRMQMFVWTRPEDLLTITAPASVAGTFETTTATFGATVTTTAVSGSVAVVNDGTAAPTLGCKPLTNTNLAGKIALIDRGTCTFSEKVYLAQQKGAIACIICNVDNTLNITMSGSTNAELVTIPIIMIKKSDCDKIKGLTESGLRLSIGRPSVSTGPNFLDGDFDNGIIAHEYGHGISSRLTGGRLNSNCLSTPESPDEGWSDFLSLAVTTKPGDRANTTRGIGTFILRQATNNPGIRRYPYTTDMKINSLTYDQIIYDPETHNVGEVWTAVLWDLYWAMVDKFGWDANLLNMNSGNAKVLKLVIDGMKIQPCNPGFLEARDAILAADKANNNGDNVCLIWEAFARRGMGFDANQGKSSSHSDGTEGFEKLPQCIKQLKMTKKATDLIKPGEVITYNLTVTNHKGVSATNIVVTDDLPASTAYLANSANRQVTVANGVLTWNIPELKTDSSITLTYKVNTDINKKSIAQFSDDMENDESKWVVDQLKPSDAFWSISELQSRSGKKSFYVPYQTSEIADQTLTTKNAVTITGTKPVLRFYHRYNTQPGFDGGIVEITTDNGTIWQDVSTKFFRTPYRGIIDYRAFVSANQKAFWGVQDTFLGSYIDMSSYIGKSVKYRFRFAADKTESKIGWYVDDVAVMDMYNYTSKARAISAQKDTAFAEAAGRGTIVDISTTTATKDLNNQLSVKVFPNPTDDILNINILDAETGNTDIQIFSTDGRLMWQTKTNLLGSKEAIIPVNTAAYPAGIYFVKIQTDKKVAVEKVVKR